MDPGDAADPYDEASRALVAAVAAELRPWIERRVLELAPDARDAAVAAASAADAEVTERLVALVAVDIDEQRTTPLGIVRSAMRWPTAALREAGARPVRRDEWVASADPDDVYDLAPVNWADLGPRCGEAGLVWGAAKAMRHLARHRPEG